MLGKKREKEKKNKASFPDQPLIINTTNTKFLISIHIYFSISSKSFNLKPSLK